MSADGSTSKALPQERPTIPVVDEPLVPVAEETNNVTEPLLQAGPRSVSTAIRSLRTARL